MKNDQVNRLQGGFSPKRRNKRHSPILSPAVTKAFAILKDERTVLKLLDYVTDRACWYRGLESEDSHHVLVEIILDYMNDYIVSECCCCGMLRSYISGSLGLGLDPDLRIKTYQELEAKLALRSEQANVTY